MWIDKGFWSIIALKNQYQKWWKKLKKSPLITPKLFFERIAQTANIPRFYQMNYGIIEFCKTQSSEVFKLCHKTAYRSSTNRKKKKKI